MNVLLILQILLQTFFPVRSFRESAKILDRKRLGKQRVEAYQILNIITNKTTSKAWRSHPAVKMWESKPDHLKWYLTEMILEWKRRGYKNNMVYYTQDSNGNLVECPPEEDPVFNLPELTLPESFHKSHRIALLKKDFQYYIKYFEDDYTHLLNEVIVPGTPFEQEIKKIIIVNNMIKNYPYEWLTI